jgi:hypothetical protein
MNKSLLLAVLCFASAEAAFAGGGGLSKDAYKAMEARIEATRKSELQTCEGAKGNAKDICRTAAKGKAKVAEAELDAEREPSPAADRAVKIAAAEADFDVARQRCEDSRGPVREACQARAEHERDAAERRAKIERVEATRRLQQAKVASAKPAPAPASRDEKYAAEKARCGMMGEDRDSCLADAKRRFGKG